MFLAKVIGTVVSTHKKQDLSGMKLLIIEPFDPRDNKKFNTSVAVDTIGAGSGEIVIVTRGTPAQTSFSNNPPIDAAVVGIVDEVEISNRE